MRAWRLCSSDFFSAGPVERAGLFNCLFEPTIGIQGIPNEVNSGCCRTEIRNRNPRVPFLSMETRIKKKTAYPDCFDL